MLEFILCSLVTIFPDYLFRRFAQGKRWGIEITFQTMWFELRWGIVSCFVLTVALITVIFYYHPATTNVSDFYRTITVLPDSGGRVEEMKRCPGRGRSKLLRWWAKAKAIIPPML